MPSYPLVFEGKAFFPDGRTTEAPPAETEILSCGHPPASGSVPFAAAADGSRICLSCAETQEKEHLKTAVRYTGYIAGDDKHTHLWQVTSFTGARLASITGIPTSRRIRGHMSSHYYYFQALDIHGNRWLVSGHGPGMYCRMRRIKNH